MGTVLVTMSRLDTSEAGPFAPILQAGHTLRHIPRARSETLAQAIDAVTGCDTVIGGGDAFNATLFDAVPELRHIARFGAGYDTVDVPAATAHGVVVTNTAGANATAVADLTLGLMIMIARNMALHDRNIRQGIWQGMMGADVWQQTLGIVGFGRIGQHVARRARGFEMKLLAYDPVPNQDAAQSLGVELTNIERVFSESDFVTLHLPASAETARLVGAPLLSLMKPTAFFINAARGAIVDEDALYAALREKRIAGAGLDVRASEPPTDGRFEELDNVVMTPHTGAATPKARVWSAQVVVEQVTRVLRGERPEGLINPEVWPAFLAARSR